MSKIKEFYHDQICQGLYPEYFENEGQLELDFTTVKEEPEFEPDACFVERMKEDEAFNQWLDMEAEKEEFMRVFDASKTFPL